MKISVCHYCNKQAVIHSPYTHLTVCSKCLKIERATASHEQLLQAEYRDAAETERDLIAGLHW